MNQTVLNSGQFRQNGAVNVAAAVSLLDIKAGAPTVQRKVWWPTAALLFGGLLTLAWDGFLFWQLAKVVMIWLGSDV